MNIETCAKYYFFLPDLREIRCYNHSNELLAKEYVDSAV